MPPGGKQTPQKFLFSNQLQLPVTSFDVGLEIFTQEPEVWTGKMFVDNSISPLRIDIIAPVVALVLLFTGEQISYLYLVFDAHDLG